MKRLQALMLHVTALALMIPVGATADFYVIPVAKKVDNLVSVAKSGGRFDDIQKAIDSINDASAQKPYTVYIAPGVYSVAAPIVMKANVSLIGAGRDVTMLQGSIGGTSIGSDAALIVGEANASIEHLSIENNSTSTIGLGVYCAGAAVGLDDVRISVTGASSNYGFFASGASDLSVARSVIAAYGDANYNIGCYINASNGSVSNSVVTAI